MAWIESHQSLLTHRKTGRLARTLGIPKVHAVGHLHAFWWWCLDNASDGQLIDSIPAEVADAAAWEGDAELFLSAMALAGFIDTGDDGVLHVHDWMDYAGRLVQKRDANAKRMKQARAKNVPSTNDERADHDSDTCDERAAHVQRTNETRATHVQGLPNPTVPNQTIDTPFTPMGGNQPLPTADVFAWAPTTDKHGKRLPDTAVTLAKVAEWRQTYPAIDVEAEVRKCIQWMRDNPAKQGSRPIARIGNWLGNAKPGAVVTMFDGEPLDPVDALLTPEQLAMVRRAKAEAEARHVRN
jgi:hypothetical protein